jgi:hypothetical protein
MADDRIFTLVGKFDDKITPSLTKLSKSITGLTRDFDKLKKNLRPIAKDMAIMAEGANRISDGFKNQRSSIDTAVRGLTEYRKELGKAASAQQKLSKRVSLPTVSGGRGGSSFGGGGGGGSARPRRGRGGGGGDYGGMGDGYTIDKGIIANLATEFITGIFNQITGAVGKAVNFVKSGLEERIKDEMGDIQSAGGILSIGKEKKVAWADTFTEAMAVQNKLNGEMANLAAALPGETEQYVQNMKMVTDTTMNVVQSNGPAMIKAMKGFNSSVVTQKDAYIEATKQLAKYTTLASIGNEGGMPLTILAEQMLNADKVNVKSLKMKFAALKKNPLVSGALEKYEAEMNKGAAGSAERYTAMIKAFEQAFPVEVLDAMTNSADGIIQGMKSSIFNPDIGLLGLGRKMSVSFKGLNRKMGPAMEELSVFDVFLKLFKAFGMVVSPILAELPKIINVFGPLLNPLKDFMVKAENTISNFKGATKKFGDLKMSFPAFRGSLEAIGKLAKSMGGDKAEYEKLETMLGSKNLDMGAALQQAIKVLFSSDALEKFGQSIGEALGGFLSMLAGFGKTADKMVGQSGLAKGFLKGWKTSGGSKAISEIVRLIVGGIVKAILGLGWEALTTDPIGTAVLATVFFAPIRNQVLAFLGRLGTGIATQMGAANVAGFVSSWGGTLLASISTWITGTVAPFIAAAAAPVLIVAAVIAVMYIFRDQIVGFFKMLSGWIDANIGGPLGEVLKGILEVWTGVLNLVHGIIDWIVGLATGDKAKMAAAWAEIGKALGQIVNGIKQVVLNLYNGIGQGADMLKNAVLNFFGNIAKALLGMNPQPPQPGGATTRAGTVGGGDTTPGRGRGGRATGASPGARFGRRGWDGKAANSMPIHSAIASEMANKPAGSDLVIANSSETIIPAAGGLAGGMEGLISATYGAANRTASAFQTSFQSFGQKVLAGQMQTTAMLKTISTQNSALMTKMTAVAAAGGLGGGGMALGGGYGSRGSQIAGALGNYLKSTGGAPGSIHEHPQHGGVKYKHSPTSYHYQGRALDIGAYANEQGGVLRRVAQFNAQMGVKPVELLKAGDPGHSDHVHVAYAMGSGNPAFFSSAGAADKWESMMAGKNPIVGSVRAQSREMKGGGTMTVNAPITIHQQPGQDSDQLASLVAIKLTQAVNQLRYSSYNV